MFATNAFTCLRVFPQNVHSSPLAALFRARSTTLSRSSESVMPSFVATLYQRLLRFFASFLSSFFLGAGAGATGTGTPGATWT